MPLPRDARERIENEIWTMLHAVCSNGHQPDLYAAACSLLSPTEVEMVRDGTNERDVLQAMVGSMRILRIASHCSAVTKEEIAAALTSPYATEVIAVVNLIRSGVVFQNLYPDNLGEICRQWISRERIIETASLHIDRMVAQMAIELRVAYEAVAIDDETHRLAVERCPGHEEVVRSRRNKRK